MKSQQASVSDLPQFEAVVRDYQNKVFRLCYAMLGSRSLAEETAQDVFLRIWKALPGFRGESSLSTWIYSITRNACLTSIKKNPAKRDFSLDLPAVRRAAERKAEDPAEMHHGPDVLLLVSQLPENYRQVILLYYMQERSYDEIALMLDLPLGTVKTYLHRARKQLSESVRSLSNPVLEENGV